MGDFFDDISRRAEERRRNSFATQKRMIESGLKTHSVVNNNSGLTNAQIAEKEQLLSDSDRKAYSELMALPVGMVEGAAGILGDVELLGQGIKGAWNADSGNRWEGFKEGLSDRDTQFWTTQDNMERTDKWLEGTEFGDRLKEGSGGRLLGEILAPLPIPKGTSALVKGVGKTVADSLTGTGVSSVNTGMFRGIKNLRDMGKDPAMFIGNNAKTWDKVSEAKALKMERAGVSPEKIWEETGTARFKDGRWRQEIDDSQAYAKPIKKGEVNKLDEAISHPELFKAYPDLANINFRYADGAGNGSYAPSLNRIRVGKASGNNPLGNRYAREKAEEAILKEAESFAVDGKLSAKLEAKYQKQIDELKYKFPDTDTNDFFADLDVSLHETTHGLQKQERFAQGGSPQDMLKQMQEDMPLTPKEDLELDAFMEYEKLGGEAEARLVELRRKLTQAQRRTHFPYDTKSPYGIDTKLEDLIIKGSNNDGTVIPDMMSIKPKSLIDENLPSRPKSTQNLKDSVMATELPNVKQDYSLGNNRATVTVPDGYNDFNAISPTKNGSLDDMTMTQGQKDFYNSDITKNTGYKTHRAEPVANTGEYSYKPDDMTDVQLRMKDPKTDEWVEIQQGADDFNKGLLDASNGADNATVGRFASEPDTAILDPYRFQKRWEFIDGKPTGTGVKTGTRVPNEPGVINPDGTKTKFRQDGTLTYDGSEFSPSKKISQFPGGTLDAPSNKPFRVSEAEPQVAVGVDANNNIIYQPAEGLNSLAVKNMQRPELERLRATSDDWMGNKVDDSIKMPQINTKIQDADYIPPAMTNRLSQLPTSVKDKMYKAGNKDSMIKVLEDYRASVGDKAVVTAKDIKNLKSKGMGASENVNRAVKSADKKDNWFTQRVSGAVDETGDVSSVDLFDSLSKKNATNATNDIRNPLFEADRTLPTEVKKSLNNLVDSLDNVKNGKGNFRQALKNAEMKGIDANKAWKNMHKGMTNAESIKEAKKIQRYANNYGGHPDTVINNLTRNLTKYKALPSSIDNQKLIDGTQQAIRDVFDRNYRGVEGGGREYGQKLTKIEREITMGEDGKQVQFANPEADALESIARPDGMTRTPVDDFDSPDYLQGIGENADGVSSVNNKTSSGIETLDDVAPVDKMIKKEIEALKAVKNKDKKFNRVFVDDGQFSEQIRAWDRDALNKAIQNSEFTDSELRAIIKEFSNSKPSLKKRLKEQRKPETNIRFFDKLELEEANRRLRNG